MSNAPFQRLGEFHLACPQPGGRWKVYRRDNPPHELLDRPVAECASLAECERWVDGYLREHGERLRQRAVEAPVELAELEAGGYWTERKLLLAIVKRLRKEWTGVDFRIEQVGEDECLRWRGGPHKRDVREFLESLVDSKALQRRVSPATSSTISSLPNMLEYKRRT
ncbi:MAG: hypothetical protein U0840_28580 [Gemmataceae bacterium]